MFKKLIKIALALMIVFALVAPSHAALRDYWAKVYAWDGSMTAKGNAVLTERNTGITFAVMMTDSSATLDPTSCEWSSRPNTRRSTAGP